MEPSTEQLDLFRQCEDIHDITQAMVVLVTDAAGVLLAISGDEDDVPVPLRRVLAREKLVAAGSVRALLEPIGDEARTWPFNVSILPVGDHHMLTILFDASANFETVQAVGNEGARAIAETLTPR